MLKKLMAVSLAGLMSWGVQAANVNNGVNMLFGDGSVVDGNFTVGSNVNGLELGLRARTRGQNDVLQVGSSNLYQATPGFANGAALWNFDFSINAGAQALSAYRYSLTISYLDGAAATFDPVFSSVADHDFGVYGVAGPGQEFAGGAYYDALSEYSFLQQSWNLEWFDAPGNNWDPNAAGLYQITLSATMDGQDAGSTTINVRVGDAPGNEVPEPTAMALVGLALVGAAAARRRRKA